MRRDPGPRTSSRIRTGDFEIEYRSVLRSLAETGRALEVNTRLPLDPLILTWWRDEGGTAITFGSDVHDAHFLAQGFDAAMVTATSHGFHPAAERHGFWTLS